ncbi:ATP-binding cassette domain-containing protein [Leptolyngbya sp. FACHB-261]|uniref:sulfate/molybdate ABC transporter ATP-binding protein n=1 Tax=Leptolyngbya sp. FACHB-261 TaxID=2692806 RepID=UPI001688F075|nr:ATP-binding cassette domain-containing protein [Leptolyngbya sp. FACHB-261]MBD2100853.1 sulfate/molybdate ABC transporter ATP-binding protein [Leptolyngbya sp. FACHB-261]
MELLVDIQKKLPGFTLEVSFRTGDKPLGLLGASGAGKSMVLRCIAGIETPTRGRIVLNGRVLFDSQKRINLPSRDRNIGFLFQNYALFPHLTVAQNVGFGLQKLPKAEQERRIAEQLALVQLQGLETRYPHQLSGGQQQRVALARALAIEPEALLLDEPFSALDTHLRSQVEKQLSVTLNSYRGVTLFVTHTLEEAYRVCQNLLILSQGKVIADGPKQAIFERPATYTVAQLTGCKNFSRARSLSPQWIEALDWDCSLRVVEPLPDGLSYIGIRAHHLTFTDSPDQDNTFPCWLIQASETPHRFTLYLKLNTPPHHAEDYHLQAEVFKDKWALIKNQPLPWRVRLEPMRLFLMQAEPGEVAERN